MDFPLAIQRPSKNDIHRYRSFKTLDEICRVIRALIASIDAKPIINITPL